MAFMDTILYVHGYGSSGNAVKGKKLQEMFPSVRVIAPTFDYDNTSPYDVQRTLHQIVNDNGVMMIVGSSFGGYHTLCSTAFFQYPVWVINPVHDVFSTLQRIVLKQCSQAVHAGDDKYSRLKQEYLLFNDEVFSRLPKRLGQVNMALSLDDELLGDHHPLLELFPQPGCVVWKDNCGHRFLRFSELQPEITHTWYTLKSNCE